MSCDMCQKTGTELNSLLGIYQTDEIKMLCPECEKIITKQLKRAQSVAHNIQCGLLKRFMAEFRKKKAPIREEWTLECVVPNNGYIKGECVITDDPTHIMHFMNGYYVPVDYINEWKVKYRRGERYA